MKIVTVEAFIPELKGNPYESAKGQAGSIPLALKFAFSNLLNKDRIRHKKISTIKATISIAHIANNFDPNEPRFCEVCQVKLVTNVKYVKRCSEHGGVEQFKAGQAKAAVLAKARKKKNEGGVCLAGPHCTGCGLKDCPVDKNGDLR